MDNPPNAIVLRSIDAVNIVRNALRLVDPRLVDHGERVGYILRQMLLTADRFTEEEKTAVFMLGLFHDIGAYKTDEIDRMIQFETDNVLDHSIYGYLFLKYFTPLKPWAKAILYHHCDYDKYLPADEYCREITLLISLADRIDVLMKANGGAFDLKRLDRYAGRKFDPRHIAWFKASDWRFRIIENLQNGRYRECVAQALGQLRLSGAAIDQYLKMLVYSIDFRSAFTVTHTIKTTAISLQIAGILRYPPKEKLHVYYGALLHDIGKIAIPLDILEYPGKLTPQAMAVMKTHVNITEQITRGMLNQAICDIAARHHEKLDGSGYPRRLTGAALTEPQRIVAVADIISALDGPRSYKTSFGKDKIIAIIRKLRDTGKLCPRISTLAIEQYDAIVGAALQNCTPVLDTYANIHAEYNLLRKKLQDRLAAGAIKD